MAIQEKEEATRQFLKKLTDALLYLVSTSEDMGFHPVACIFSIVLASLKAGPEEFEILHKELHKYLDKLMERRGDKPFPELKELGLTIIHDSTGEEL